MFRRRSICPVALIQTYATPPKWTPIMDDNAVSDELLEVRRRRYEEARNAGLSIADALVFADSDTDIGLLRKLVGDGCDPDLIAAVIL